MPTYSITDPDGRTHTIDGPAGATRGQVIAEIQRQLPYEQRTVSEQLPIDWREAGLGTMVKHGFNRALTGLGSTVTDLIPALAGSALGFKDYAAGQLEEAAAKQKAAEEQYPTAFKSFRDIRGVGDAAGFVAETFGELIPDIVALMTGAGAASVVGKRVALKGVEKLVATRAAEAVTAQGLKGEAAKEATALLIKEAAPLIEQATARGAATGLKYGLPASSYALNAPDVFQSIYEKTEKDAEGGQHPYIAAAMGVPIAMLDTFLPKRILDKLGSAGKAQLAEGILAKSTVIPGSFKAVAGKELLKVMGGEGLTESAQEALTVAAEMMAGAKGEFFSQENIDRYINAGLKGAIGGGAFGGPGAIRSGLQAKGEKDRLAGEAAANAIPVETPQQALLALENKLFTPVVFPDGSVATTPEQVKEYEESLFQQKFTRQPADVLFTPEDIAAETARRSAEAITPTNSAQEAAGAFTAAPRQPAPPLFPELPPVYAPKQEAPTIEDRQGEPIPQVAPTVTRQELLGLGISKNARVSGMAQRVPLVNFLSGLPLDNPQNVNTVITQLSAFAANPVVKPEVKANVNQFLRGLVQSIQTMNTQQGALQFAPAAPEFRLPNTPMQAPLADFGADRQRQQQMEAQQEQDFQRAEAQRVAQEQLELAQQGAQRAANERQKEARMAKRYPKLVQGQRQGDLFGLIYPEAPSSTPPTSRAAPPEVNPNQLSMIGRLGDITEEAQSGTTTDTPAGESTVVSSQSASSVPPGRAATSGTGGMGSNKQSAGTTSVGKGAQPGALNNYVYKGPDNSIEKDDPRGYKIDKIDPSDSETGKAEYNVVDSSGEPFERFNTRADAIDYINRSRAAAGAQPAPKRSITGFGAGKAKAKAKAAQQAAAPVSALQVRQAFENAQEIGRGGNAVVYDIPGTQFVLRVPNQAELPAPSAKLVPVTDPFSGRNFGQPVFMLGWLQVLHRQNGIPAGLSIPKKLSQEEADSRYALAIKAAAAMPQSAYDQFAADLVYLNQKGGLFDPSKSNNVLIDQKNAQFNLVDIAQGSKFKNDGGDIIITLMGNTYAWKYKGNENLKPHWQNIYKKAISAIEKNNLEFDKDSPSVAYSRKFAGLNAAAEARAKAKAGQQVAADKAKQQAEAEQQAAADKAKQQAAAEARAKAKAAQQAAADKVTADKAAADKANGKEGDFAYHYGDLQSGEDTRAGKMSGRSTGHFGTGVYFYGKKLDGNNKFDRSGRPLHIVDLSKYKLYKPADYRTGKDLHDALRKVNNLVHRDHDKKDLNSAASDVWVQLGSGKNNEETIKNIIESAVKDTRAELEAKDALFTSQYVPTAATRVVQALGWDGIDVRGIEGLDSGDYGTVVYGEKLEPEDKVSRKINKIALKDKKAKAAADEAEQQQNLRSEAKRILTAAGEQQTDITARLNDYSSFTQKDIDDLLESNPPQGQKPKSKMTREEVEAEAAPAKSESVKTKVDSDNNVVVVKDTSETTDAVEAVEESDNDIVADAVEKLDAPDIATLEKHYGEEADSEGFAAKLSKDIQTALDRTKGGIAAISKSIRSIIKQLITLILAVSVAFNPVAFNSESQAFNLPLPQTTTELTQIIDNPRADFGNVTPSATTAVLAAYVVGTNDNRGMPFIITDKPTATSYVFDAKGTLTAVAPVLMGAARYADVIPTSALNKTVEQTTQAEKVTPAGRYEGKVEPSAEYGSAFRFIELGNSTIAGHITYTGTPSENRPGRLATPTVDDNFITLGCLNYGKKFYRDHIEEQFKNGGIQYITPMVQTLEETFPGITAYSPTTTVTTVVTSIINNPQSATDVANHSEQGVLRQRPAGRKAAASISNLRKLPKTSDRGFAESVNALRREDESPYIVQETKTSDDINKIAEEVLKDVAANPERYAVQVNSLTADQYFRDETTGEKVDITNPNEHYRLSDLGRQLAKTDPATLKATLQQEAEQTTKQRQDALRDLSNYLIGNLWLDGDGNYTPYTPTEAGRIVLLASKLSYVETKEGVQIVQLANNNRHVMTVSGELASRINEKLNGGLSIKEALKKAVEENTAAQKRSSDEQGWKKYKQSEAYEDAAVLSQEVCGTGWCTGTTSTAQSQLSKGDFWVYFDNGKPEIALRTEDGSLTAADPPRGTLPGQRLSPEYQEIADKFLRATDEVKGGEAYLKARDAMEAYRTYKKTNDIVPLREHLTYTIQEGRFVRAKFVEPKELSGYGEPAKYSVADPEYFGKPTPKRVPFSVEIAGKTTDLEFVGGSLETRSLTSAPMLKTVGGGLYADNLTSAPMLKTIGGELIAYALTSAPMLKTVGDNFYAPRLTSAPMLETAGSFVDAPRLTSAPMLREVGRELAAENLTSAPMLETVGGRLHASSLISAPMLETVGGNLDASNLTSAPMLKTIGGSLYANRLTSAPMLREVGRELVADNLTSAPMLREVGRELVAENLTSAPMLKTVGGYLGVDKLTSAPMLETVGAHMHADKLTSAPMLKTVGGGLYANRLTSAPMLETVGGDLDASNLTSTPMLREVGGPARRRLFSNAEGASPNEDPLIIMRQEDDPNPFPKGMKFAVGNGAYGTVNWFKTAKEAEAYRKDEQAFIDSQIGKAEPLASPTEDQLEESYHIPLPAAAVTALENNDLKGALRALSMSKDSEVAKLAKGFLNANVNATVKLTKGLKNDRGQAVPGFYDPETNTMHLDPTSMTTHTVLHEASHSGLSHVIEDKNNIVTRQLNKLFNDVIPMLDSAYGAESLQEFVAEAKSNLEFRGKLNAMNPDGSAITAWQRFTNIVGNWMRRLMGNPTRSIGSALDKTDKLIAIILSPAPMSRDGGALYAAALYGKTGIEKLFDSVARLVPMVTPAQKQKAVYAVTEFLTNTVRGGIGRAYRGALPLNLLADLENPIQYLVKRFSEAERKRTGEVNKRNAEIEPLIKRAQNWAKAYPTLEIIFNNVVYFSTVNGVDPTKKESDYDAKSTVEKGKLVRPTQDALDEAKETKANWREVKAMYEKLNPEGQKLYVAMRNAYAQMYREILDALSLKVDAIDGITPGEAAEIKNKVFAELLAKAKLDPYFPLTRSGNYWMSYLVSGTEGYTIEAFTSEAARSNRIRELLDKKIIFTGDVERDGKTVKEPNVQVYSNINQIPRNRVPSTSFVGAVLTKLDQGNVKPEVKEAVLKLFVDTLPETAFAKAFQNRKNTPGFERDAISALRGKMYNTSRQLANMKTASELEKIIAEAREISLLMSKGALKDAKGNYIPPSDNAEVAAIIEELQARLSFIANPKVPSWSQALTSTGFNMLLGANISSALVNLMQVPMILAPYLTGEHGIEETRKAITDAYKVFAGSGISRQQQVFGTNEKDTVKTGPSIINYAPDSENGKKYKTAIGIWEANAQLGSSMTYDVLDAPTSRINFWSGLPFHHAERINREVSLISAYNLEMDRLKKYGEKTKDGILARTLTPEGRETAAANYAVYVAEMTQGGTSAASAPRYAQGPIGRVLLMFKRYGIMSLYLQFKMLKQSLVGATDKERKAAFKQFAGVTGMAALFAGLQGIPFFGMAAFIYGLFKDDDDDDLATEVRKVAGPFWTYGPVSALTNLNIAGRLSQTDLLVRDMQQGDSPSTLATIGAQLLGPVYGVASKVERGFTLMGEGHLGRGIEQVLPSAFGNLFKAARFATEGANTLRGDPITGEVNAWNVGAEALGFLPADYARQLEISNHLKGIDKYVSTKETKLLRKYYTATRFRDFDEQQDARDALQALFRKHPGLGNLSEVISNSMASHQKTTSRMIHGVTFNAKLEGELRRRGAEME